MSNATLARGRAPLRSATGGPGDLVLVVLVAVAVVVVVTAVGPLPVRMASGFFILIVLPVLLVNAKLNWSVGIRLHESLVYSLALVVLGLMLGGFLVNGLLRLLGYARPLDRVPVVVALLVILVGLGLWRSQRWRLYSGLSGGRGTLPPANVGARDQLMLVAGVILVVSSVAGAIRLNNGLDGGLATATLILAAVLIVLAFVGRRVLRESTVVATIYLVSLSMLLMTSLRGWFVTGHDVQREFRTFALTSGSGVWNFESARSAYNACLSINILPTIIQHVTGIPDLYVFKTVFQLLFALCPVLIYLITRRFFPKSVAIIATVYFIAFPTYIGDMPFLNRQEVAFFFLGVALLLVTNREVPIRTRKRGFVVFGVGVILSHYSTTYVLLGILIVGWILYGAARAFCQLVQTREGQYVRARHRHVTTRHRQVRIDYDSPRVLTFGVIATLGALAIVWSGPITGTAGHAAETFESTVSALMGKSGGQRSSDTSYSIFGGKKQSPEKLFQDYRNQSIEETAQGRKDGENYPLSEIDQYPFAVVSPDPALPVTTLGQTFEAVGIDVSAVNGLLRTAAPILLQIFIGLGFSLILLSGLRGFRQNPEFVCCALGCSVLIALQVLLPNLSADYGILRTFAQGLFWLAPFVAIGSIQAFGWLGNTRSINVAMSVCVVLFLSLTGVMPQMLGGYPPQLHLNNSGKYYDKYYLHDQEAAAMEWLQRRLVGEEAASVNYEVAGGLYAFTRSQIAGEGSLDDDVFPGYVRTDSYAFLGDTPMRKGEVATFFSGDELTYHYPIEFLDKNKSLIYSSDGARVYR